MTVSMEFVKKFQLLNTKIGMLIFNGKEIPEDLRMEHNKLLNDYNEAFKKEKT